MPNIEQILNNVEDFSKVGYKNNIYSILNTCIEPSIELHNNDFAQPDALSNATQNREIIQQAINNAEPNDVICLPSGTYSIEGKIFINKSNITLSGTNGEDGYTRLWFFQNRGVNLNYDTLYFENIVGSEGIVIGTEQETGERYEVSETLNSTIIAGWGGPTHYIRSELTYLLNIGDLVKFEVEIDDDFINHYDMELYTDGQGWNRGIKNFAIRKVKHIIGQGVGDLQENNDMFTINNIRYPFDLSVFNNIYVSKITNPIENVVIKDLVVSNVIYYDDAWAREYICVGDRSYDSDCNELNDGGNCACTTDGNNVDTCASSCMHHNFYSTDMYVIKMLNCSDCLIDNIESGVVQDDFAIGHSQIPPSYTDNGSIPNIVQYGSSNCPPAGKLTDIITDFFEVVMPLIFPQTYAYVLDGIPYPCTNINKTMNYIIDNVTTPTMYESLEMGWNEDIMHNWDGLFVPEIEYISGPHSDTENITNENRHLLSNGILVKDSINVSIKNTTMQLPINRTMGNGTLFYIDSSNEILIENCVGYRGRHNFSLGGWGTSGVVLSKIHSEGGWGFGLYPKPLLKQVGAAAPAAPAHLYHYENISEDWITPEFTKEDLGFVFNEEITEASGIAASKINTDIFWTHNDSGGGNKIYSIGASEKTFEIPNSENIDWEDITLGPGPISQQDYIYVGDIGSGNSVFKSIYRIKEPNLNNYSTQDNIILDEIDVEKINFIYPDYDTNGNHIDINRDAETLMIDPTTKKLYIITKEFIADGIIDDYGYPCDAPEYDTWDQYGEFPTQYNIGQCNPNYGGGIATVRIYELENPDEIPEEPLVATYVNHIKSNIPILYNNGLQTYDLIKIVGGDISPEGDSILIKTYSNIFYIRKNIGHSIGEAFNEPMIIQPARYDIEQQGEAVTFGSDKFHYYTISEEFTAADLFLNNPSDEAQVLDVDSDYWSRQQELEITSLFFGYPTFSGTNEAFSYSNLVTDSDILDGWFSINREGLSGKQGLTTTKTTFWNIRGNPIPNIEQPWKDMSVPGMSALASFQASPHGLGINPAAYPYENGGLIVNTTNMNVFTDVDDYTQYIDFWTGIVDDYFIDFDSQNQLITEFGISYQPPENNNYFNNLIQIVIDMFSNYFNHIIHDVGMFQILQNYLQYPSVYNYMDPDWYGHIYFLQPQESSYYSTINECILVPDSANDWSPGDTEQVTEFSIGSEFIFDSYQNFPCLGRCNYRDVIMLKFDAYGDEQYFWNSPGYCVGLSEFNMTTPLVEVNVNDDYSIDVYILFSAVEIAITAYMWLIGDNIKETARGELFNLKYKNTFNPVIDNGIIIGYTPLMEGPCPDPFDPNSISGQVIQFNDCTIASDGIDIDFSNTALNLAYAVVGGLGLNNYIYEKIFGILADTLQPNFNEIFLQILNHDKIINLMRVGTFQSSNFTLGPDGSHFSSGESDLNLTLNDIPLNLYDYQKPILGDLNQDETINIFDVVILVECLLGGVCPPGSDINGDGIINVVDVVAMINLLFNNTTRMIDEDTSELEIQLQRLIKTKKPTKLEKQKLKQQLHKLKEIKSIPQISVLKQKRTFVDIPEPTDNSIPNWSNYGVPSEYYEELDYLLAYSRGETYDNIRWEPPKYCSGCGGGVGSNGCAGICFNYKDKKGTKTFTISWTF